MSGAGISRYAAPQPSLAHAPVPITVLVLPPLQQHGNSLEAQSADCTAPTFPQQALLSPEARPVVLHEQAEHAAKLCTHGTLVWGESIIKVDLLALESRRLLQELMLLLNCPKLDKHRPWLDLLASPSLCWWLAKSDCLAVCDWLEAHTGADLLQGIPCINIQRLRDIVHDRTGPAGADVKTCCELLAQI